MHCLVSNTNSLVKEMNYSNEIINQLLAITVKTLIIKFCRAVMKYSHHYFVLFFLFPKEVIQITQKDLQMYKKIVFFSLTNLL